MRIEPIVPRIARAIFAAVALAVLGAASALAAAASAQSFDYYRIGDVDAPRPAAVEPGYLMLGGGDWPPDAFRWFAARTGNGHLVALAASGDDDMQKEIFNDIGGFASVETIVFHSRKAAADPRVLALVRKADGIFFRGGDQANYVRYWKGTPLNMLLDEHVRAGRPIGGTSAGLAILGAFSYGAMDGGSIESPTALADPFGPPVTLVEDFLHLPFLQHVITDSHFAKRKRQGRLIAFIARLAAEHRDPAITGLGIDQEAGICVDGHGMAKVYSLHGGYAWIVRPMRFADTIKAGRPLDFRDVTVVGAGTGSDIDLTSFTVSHPAFVTQAQVVHGRLSISNPIDHAR